MLIEQGVVEVARVDARQGVEMMHPEEYMERLGSRLPVMLAVLPGVLVLAQAVTAYKRP